MKKLVYLIAVAIVIGWVIGFIRYNMEGLFHLLLPVACIIAIVGILQGERR